MADYYLAPSLISLRNELNAAHPNRDKSSDGWIGDASHAARASDHNPDWTAGGVVRAIDVDKDGIDIDALFRALIADDRVEYIIWAGHIATRANGFRWAVYTGPNDHSKHMHVSLRHIKSAEKSGKWGYSPGSVAAPAAPAPTSGKKSVAQIADEVIAGHWGNGSDRSSALQNAGYSPTEVQAAVNAKLGGGHANAVQPSITALATQVIAGQWGNGQERERRITAAGYDYAAVRAEVNRRLK